MNSTHATETSRAETHRALQKPPEASSCPLMCTENTTTPCTIQLNRLHSFATPFCSAFTFSSAHLVHLALGTGRCSGPTRRKKESYLWPDFLEVEGVLSFAQAHCLVLPLSHSSSSSSEELRWLQRCILSLLHSLNSKPALPSGEGLHAKPTPLALAGSD